jgi:hypothetical protein
MQWPGLQNFQGMHDDDVGEIDVVGLHRGRPSMHVGFSAPTVGCVLTDTALPPHCEGSACRAALQ